MDHDAMLLAHLDRTESRCPRCRYELKGLTEAICPECGVKLLLGVDSEDSPQGEAPWATAMSALVAAAGLGVVVAFIGVAKPDRVFGTPLLLLASLCGLVSIPLAALVVAFRWRFVRLSRRVQWCLAILALLIVITEYGGFLAHSVGS